MSPEELDKLRLEDIEFFAHRYAERFGEHFDRNTDQEKEKFYEEIKAELLEKVPKYEIVEEVFSHDAQAQAHKDRIEFGEASGTIEKRSVRIHEIMHSYNRMENSKHGLRDFENNFVLKNLDEGSTEWLTEMLLGEEYEDSIVYSDYVEQIKFLTSLVGERTMLHATRGNPQLLSETLDDLLGTEDFLPKMERKIAEWSKVVAQSFGSNAFDGSPVGEDIKILSKLKGALIKNETHFDMLIDAVIQSKNRELYERLVQEDEKIGHNRIQEYSMKQLYKQEEKQQSSLADVQQNILRSEIYELENSGETSVETLLELELKKFIYDRVEYQKHFINHPEPEYDQYEKTPEDIEFTETFKSDLDGASERLGSKIGMYGVNNKVYSLENVPHLIGTNTIKNIPEYEVEFSEARDFSVELWAEVLNAAQAQKILDDWKEYIYSFWYKEKFPGGEKETFLKAVEGVKRKIESDRQGLGDKYKAKQKEIDTFLNEAFENDTGSSFEFVGEQLTGAGPVVDTNNDVIDVEIPPDPLQITDVEIPPDPLQIIDVEMPPDPLQIIDVEIPPDSLQIIDVEIPPDPLQIIDTETHINTTEAEQPQKQVESKSLELWHGRFRGWYEAVDRLSKNVKAKFLKMREDITKAIAKQEKRRANIDKDISE